MLMLEYTSQKQKMRLFHHVQFKAPDPLDDGTAEEIAHEKDEAAINLFDERTDNVIEFWNDVSKTLNKEKSRN